MEYMKILSESRLFDKLSYDEIDQFLCCTKAYTKTFPRGSQIIPVGEKLDAILLVVEGVCKVYHGGDAQSDSIPGLLHPPQGFGLSYLFTGEVSLVSVKAIASCKILFLPFQGLLASCEGCDTIRQQVLHNIPILLAENVLRLERKLSYTHRNSLRGKISAYLLDVQRTEGGNTFQIPLNRTHLSQYLDASRTALSRELSTMQQEGLLSYDDSTFTLLDVEGLQDCTVS